MELNKQTAERIKEDLQAYLSRGHFAYVAVNETAERVETFSTGHHLVSGNWTDGSSDSVRIMPHDDGRIWIEFSIAGWFFSVQEGARIYVGQGDGVKIRYIALCGDERLDWLKLEHEDAD